MIVFDRPVGAPADVAELEYIAALQQTCRKRLRLDGTVTAEDIRYFLVSRHGIRRSTTEIGESILHQLAASHEVLIPPAKPLENNNDDEEDEEESSFFMPVDCNSQSRKETTVPESSPHAPVDQELSSKAPVETSSSKEDSSETMTDAEKESSSKDEEKHELLNGFFSFFPFLYSETPAPSPVGQDESASDATANIEKNPAESEASNHEIVTNAILEQGQVKPRRLSLLAYIPKPGEVDEWEELVMDGKDTNQYESMDIVQQAALLFIPELMRARTEILPSPHEDQDDEPGHQKDADALFEVFLRILCNACQIEPGVELTKDLLVEILKEFGEAWPDEIVEEMWKQAITKGTAGEIPLLTAQTLMQVLTIDIQDFPTEREFIPSTHLNDALSRQPGSPLDRIFTVSNLDYTADTYSSFWWANLAWISLVIWLIAYVMRGFTGVNSQLGNLDCDTSSLTDLGCRLAKGIITWFEIFLELTFLGFPLIYLSTIGNSVYTQRDSVRTYLAYAIGIAAVLVYSVVFYSVEFKSKLLTTEKEESNMPMFRLSLGTGLILLIVQLGHFLRILVPPKTAELPWFKPFASGMVRMERWTKLSAAFKVQKMLANALFCHCDDMSQLYPSFEFDEKASRQMALRMASKVSNNLHGDEAFTLLRFQEQADLREKSPNIFSVWRKVISKQMQKEQGIWLSPRLGSSNLIQWLIVVCIPFGCILLWKQLDSDFGELLLQYPTLKQWDLRAAILVGGFAAFVGATYIALMYIPSAISLTMQFRTGVLGCLRDEEFLVYRKAQDTRTMLYGVALWGIILTVVLLWISFGALAFLFVFESTRYLMSTIIINIFGFLITFMIKEVALTVFRTNWYRGFYRRKPAQGNILNTIMDCWNLAFSAMFIVARLGKVFLSMAVNIGRVDTPFLSKEVTKLGPHNLDGFPVCYRRDLLSHDAHRHPYLERLGLLYLLKLRLGPKFATRAGGAWRILLVLTLMPWLRRYRKTYIQYRNSSLPISNSNHSIPGSGRSLHGAAHNNAKLSSRNEELERENEVLRRTLAQYEKALGRGSSRRSSVFIAG